MQKAPGRWPGAFLFIFEVSDELYMRLFEPFTLVEFVRLLPRSTRGNFHLNGPRSLCKRCNMLHQYLPNLLRAIFRFHIHFLNFGNQGSVMQ
ncbi:hypothetical protein CLV60_11334 [Dyadobacter jiangsuensis]|uniref:Uncharacterized protein n=1 Tax=Dyadobacter jiangsuensis TaxID=1591085 RepID=A0A2P8FSA2_9BACT|nr:hypothetical protein CLV60_11334 [Dyadobacter jiangsuensis]